MTNFTRVLLTSSLIISNLFASPSKLEEAVDWPAFMEKQDMHFKKLPKSWQEAPHFGNAMVGSMLYQAGKANAIRLQLFRADVQDHRDDTHGWTAYSRPRLGIGSFHLTPVGKLTGCTWRKDLWNAEMTGTITTTKGTIKIRHYVHADDMAIITELTPSEGEQAASWTWHPVEAKSTRGGYPTQAKQIAGFAKTYGPHYAKTLKVFQPNPKGRQETKGEVMLWIQDLLAGGQHVTAWTEFVSGDTRTHVATITKSYPDKTAEAEANNNILKYIDQLRKTKSAWLITHQDWWHSYYQRSFITLPDPKIEASYWQTIYRFACSSRVGRSYIDCPALWFQGGSRCYTTTDWNIQAAHWGLGAANRIEQGGELLERFHAKRENLTKAVRPVEWQKDSAYLAIEVAGDLICNREQDMRYYHCVGLLPWTMNNFWMQYRFTMDDDMLREKIYPLLRRSINMYLHMLKEDENGKLRLPPTYSPETSVVADANFDLALLKWGCHTLLKTCKRLGINDPLIPRWKDVIARTIDFPQDENGFRLGSNKAYDGKHRHLSHLLMMYPLHLVNIDQPEHQNLLKVSLNRANKGRTLKAMLQTHAGPMAAHMGLGEVAYKGLKDLISELHPNGMWYNPPCMESSLGQANIVQEMLLQSWSDPTKDETGPIRIFPACPEAWADLKFHHLRAEGAFIISAERKASKTAWVTIKSLAGEPCIIRPNFKGRFKLNGKREFTLKETSPGTYTIDLKKGEEVQLLSTND